MNKINPLYIIALLLIMVIFMISKTGNLQQQINAIKVSIATTQITGKYLADLKKEFSNKQQHAKIAQSIIEQQGLMNDGNTFKVNPTNITIELNNLNNAQTQKVVSKLINSSLYITRFAVEDVDLNKSMRMEIKL